MANEKSNPQTEKPTEQQDKEASERQTETEPKQEDRESSEGDPDKLFNKLKEKAKQDSYQFLNKVEDHADSLREKNIPEEDLRKLTNLTQELDKQEKYLLRAKHDLEDPDFIEKIDKKNRSYKRSD